MADEHEFPSPAEAIGATGGSGDLFGMGSNSDVVPMFKKGNTQNTKRGSRMSESYSKKEIDLMMENMSIRLDGRLEQLVNLVQQGFQKGQTDTERQLAQMEKRFEQKFDQLESRFGTVETQVGNMKTSFEAEVKVLNGSLKQVNTLVFVLILPLVLALVGVFTPIILQLWTTHWSIEQNQSPAIQHQIPPVPAKHS